jgi:hypothetical protein
MSGGVFLSYRVIAVSARLRGKEILLPSRSNEARSSEARTRAEASFKKEERAREGAQAMAEYLANGRAVRERTAQLRALRLAKEAADKEQAAAEGTRGKR